MPRETDLAYGLLALQMDYVTRDQFLECTSLWLNDLDTAILTGEKPHSFASLFQELGYLDPTRRAAPMRAISRGGGM